MTYIISSTVAPQGPRTVRECSVLPLTLPPSICTGFANGTLAGILAFGLTFATSHTCNLRAHHAFLRCRLCTTARIEGPRSLLRGFLHGGWRELGHGRWLLLHLGGWWLSWWLMLCVSNCRQPRRILSSHGKTMRDGAQLRRRVNFGDVSRPGVVKGGDASSPGEAARVSPRSRVVSCGPGMGWGQRADAGNGSPRITRTRRCRLAVVAQSCRIATGTQSVSLHSDRVVPRVVMAFDAAGTRVINVGLSLPTGQHLALGPAAGIKRSLLPPKKL
jgi:hypothetical protein